MRRPGNSSRLDRMFQEHYLPATVSDLLLEIYRELKAKKKKNRQSDALDKASQNAISSNTKLHNISLETKHLKRDALSLRPMGFMM